MTNDRLAAALRSGLRVLPPDAADLAAADAIFVCVPTPITTDEGPGPRPGPRGGRDDPRALRNGHLIVLQSTTFPGTTIGPFREVLERDRSRRPVRTSTSPSPGAGQPGDPASASKGVPRLVGATTPEATKRAAALLANINDHVIEMSSPDAAELSKLLENVFRNVNIAFVNQLALLCERMGLDVWEVINAAATKPFGFMKFTPGPGVGGHCIPVDPYYLAWRAREFDFIDRFIELAGDINFAMPRHVVELVADALNDRGLAVNGAKVGDPGRRLQAERARRSQLPGRRRHRRGRGARRGGALPRSARGVVHGRGGRRARGDRPRRAARLGRRHRRRDAPSRHRLGDRVRARGPRRRHRRQLARTLDARAPGAAPGGRLVDASVTTRARASRAGAARPVLMIVHSYYEEDPRVRREAESLVAAGRPVVVLGLRQPDGPAVSEVAGVRVQHLDVQRHQGAGLGVYLREYASFLVRAMFAAVRLHRRERFALVQVHSLPDYLVFAALPLRLVGVPVLLDLHEAMPEFFRSRFPGASNPLVHRLLMLQERLSIAASTAVITVNPAMRDRLVQLGVPAEKAGVVVNSPSLGRFDRRGLAAARVSRRTAGCDSSIRGR